MQIFLGLSSNLGDREMYLVNARDLLMKHDVLVIGQSEVRETVPLGGKDQPMYLNQVIECRTDLKAEDLFAVCKTVERGMGRPVKPTAGNVQFGVKAEPKWESRIIDIDILYYGDAVMELPLLTIPHLGTYDRPFLTDCMCDLDPEFMHPKLKKSMKELLLKA